MRRLSITSLVLLLIGSGCASNHVAQENPNWLLMTSPATRDYPLGWSHMPLAQWEPMMVYPNEETCDRSLRDAQNAVQSPVRCIAEDDKRLGKRAATAFQMHVGVEGGEHPVLSSVASDR